MQKNGYITITESEESKRSSCVNITTAGIKALVRSDKVLNSFISAKYSGISDEELVAYLNTMKKMEANLIKIYKMQRKEDK